VLVSWLNALEAAWCNPTLGPARAFGQRMVGATCAYRDGFDIAAVPLEACAQCSGLKHDITLEECYWSYTMLPGLKPGHACNVHACNVYACLSVAPSLSMATMHSGATLHCYCSCHPLPHGCFRP
jgi:hypothetical protein